MSATATLAPAGPQYMRALERANKVRLARADLKRRIATGELPAAEVILQCPWEAQSMTVADLLMSQRRWGESRCRKLLAQLQMSETKTLGSLTDRQRQHACRGVPRAGRDPRAQPMSRPSARGFDPRPPRRARIRGDEAFCRAPVSRAPGARGHGNGQPEESFSCHQPASMPIRPRRGRTSHTPQPRSPRSVTRRRTNL